MAPLFGLLSFLGGVWFLLGMPIVAAYFGREYLRRRKTHAGFIIAVVMLVVFHVTAGLIWTVGSAHWGLSFLETLEASVNSAKYGHPVEHRAEVMVVWLLMLSTLAALAAGVIAAAAGAAIGRRHSARDSALTSESRD